MTRLVGARTSGVRSLSTCSNIALPLAIPQDVQEVLAVARARQRPKRGGTWPVQHAKVMKTSISLRLEANTQSDCPSRWLVPLL